VFAPTPGLISLAIYLKLRWALYHFKERTWSEGQNSQRIINVSSKENNINTLNCSNLGISASIFDHSLQV
jgi:hypothetical protein